MKNNQHDGGGSFCMCDTCQEFRKHYLGFDADEFERIINKLKSKEVEKELTSYPICARILTTERSGAGIRRMR